MDLQSELFKQPAETISERIGILFKTEELSDCSFALGEKKEKIVAHRIFLAITSPVFFSMFFGKLAEASEISIPDLKPSAFTGMLKYIYTDAIEFDCIQHAVDVLMAAKKYIIPQLERKCLSYIQINTTIENCVELFELGKELAYKSLEESCLDVIRQQTSEVIGDKSFLEASESTVRIVVSQDTLNIGSEFQLFKRVEAWMVAESKRRGKALKEMVKRFGEIIKHVRFLAMPSAEFSSGPAESELLSDNEKLALLQWSSLRNSKRLPSSLSRFSHSRCDKLRTCGTLTFTMELSLLCGMTPGEKIYSQPSTIANVPWQIKIEGMKGSSGRLLSIFSICTKDEGKNIKHPSSATLRLLDGEGVELSFKGGRKGWQELKDNSCHDKEGQLCLKYPVGLNIVAFKKVYDRLQVEVVIKNE